MIKQIGILVMLALMSMGCNNVNNSFLNANLDEHELAWANEAMSSLCQESLGKCCTNIDERGDNTIVIVSENPNSYVGMQQTNLDPFGEYTPSMVSILDMTKLYGDNVEAFEHMFKCVVKHELIHHCTHKRQHLGPGNVMAFDVSGMPQNGKLSLEDVNYITN